MILMIITFVGFASNKPNDNFNYDKYIESYILEYKCSKEHDNYLDFQIKKTKWFIIGIFSFN